MFRTVLARQKGVRRRRPTSIAFAATEKKKSRSDYNDVFRFIGRPTRGGAVINACKLLGDSIYDRGLLGHFKIFDSSCEEGIY